jgi:hypothetical protein
MEETLSYVWTLYAKENKPVIEPRIVHFIRERAPAHSVMRILEVMVKSRMLEIMVSDGRFTGYKPTSREVRLSGG